MKKTENTELEIDLLSDEELNKILETNNQTSTETELKQPEQIKKKKTKIIEDSKKLDLSHLYKHKNKSIKDQVKQQLNKVLSKKTLGKLAPGRKTKDVIDIIKSEKKKIKKIETSNRAKVFNDKFELIRHTKSATNEPLQKAEVKKIIINNYLTNQKIEQEIRQKRSVLKNIQKIKSQTKECNCEHKFAYFKDNTLYSTCSKCSELKEWKNINDWYKYIKQQGN